MFGVCDTLLTDLSCVKMNADQQLLLSIDEKKTGTHHPFDVLEAMMKILPEAQKK